MMHASVCRNIDNGLKGKRTEEVDDKNDIDDHSQGIENDGRKRRGKRRRE